MSEEIRKKTLLFNTFFFNKLTSRPKSGDIKAGLDKNLQMLKKWIRHDDIFSKDFLIVPVNRAKHWFLLIVCYHNRVPDFVDVDSPNGQSLIHDPRAPCILLMDSLGTCRNGGRYKLTDPLRNLMSAEWKERKGTEKIFSHKAMPDRRVRVTEQDNYYDCGLYLLQYVEQFLKDPSDILGSANNERRDWVERSVMKGKRDYIRGLILTLRYEQLPLHQALKSEAESKIESETGMDISPETEVEELGDGSEQSVERFEINGEAEAANELPEDEIALMNVSSDTKSVSGQEALIIDDD